LKWMLEVSIWCFGTRTRRSLHPRSPLWWIHWLKRWSTLNSKMPIRSLLELFWSRVLVQRPCYIT
jgi:hypothetical protein